MWHSAYPIALLYGRSNGHRTRAVAYAELLIRASTRFAINRLRAVGRNVDAYGVEGHERINRLIYLLHALATQGGEYFE